MSLFKKNKKPDLKAPREEQNYRTLGTYIDNNYTNII